MLPKLLDVNRLVASWSMVTTGSALNY